MVDTSYLAHELRERVNAHLEWLLVRQSGRSFPLRRDEIEISSAGDRIRLGALEDSGFGMWSVRSVSNDDGELVMEVGANGSVETVRLVPRMPARELSANIELARLERANLIAKAGADACGNITPARTAL